jgi:hypothetical protein
VRSLAPGHTYHHQFTGFPFRQRQYRIAVIWLALENRGLAGPADSLPATVLDVHTGIQESTEDGIVTPHSESPAASRQLDCIEIV